MNPSRKKTRTIGKKVRALYAQEPFLAKGTHESVFASARQGLPRGKAIEVGCGGGGITTVIASRFNTVVGADFTPKAIAVAKQYTKEKNISNIRFIVADIFDDAFIRKHEGLYDYVLCFGVLHHTGNATEGFQRIARLVKEGGVLTIGVYSRTRIRYRFRRFIVRCLAGDDFKSRERWARKLFYRNCTEENIRMTIFDGYVHPEVSYHSINQVLQWGAREGLAYQGSWPPIELEAYPRLLKTMTYDLPSAKKPLSSIRRLSYLLVEAIWTARLRDEMVSVSWKRPIVKKTRA